jgi:transcriptional regulator with XRE-family HTH domain
MMPNPETGGAERDRDPSVYRRSLRKSLRRIRETLKITQAAAAEEMSWSPSKIIRIETGIVGISISDLRSLLAYYQISSDSEQYENLIETGKQARRTPWAAQYKEFAGDVFLTFLGHEDSATRSYSFQPILVPGLLQTDEYATQVLQVIRGPKTATRIRALTDLRLARQERVFARGDGIRLNYLLDESVVRRAVGGPEVMKRQVTHLINSCQRENVSIRILPFKLGLYRSIRVPFVVLEFDEPGEAALLYLEYPHKDAIIREDGPYDEGGTETETDEPTTPPTYLQIFTELQEQTTEAETLEILQSALRELEA